jgi:TonB family protein
MSTRPENSVEDSGGDGAQVQLGAHGGSPAETHPEARNDQERVENLLAEEAADAAKAADGKGQPSSVTTVKPPVVQNASRIRLLAAALILVALAGVAYQRGYRADWLANRFFTASTAGAATVSPAKASQAPKGTSAANTASAATNAPLADASLRPQDPSEPARDDASQGRKPPRSSSVDSDPRGAERLANVSSAALASDSTGAADEPPTLVKSVNAVPPPEAVQNFVTGDVKFDALVDATGQVSSAFVVSGPSALRAAALEALKHYQYKPATRNGQPVAGHVTVIVKFWYEP